MQPTEENADGLAVLLAHQLLHFFPAQSVGKKGGSVGEWNNTHTPSLHLGDT